MAETLRLLNSNVWLLLGVLFMTPARQIGCGRRWLQHYGFSIFAPESNATSRRAHVEGGSLFCRETEGIIDCRNVLWRTDSHSHVSNTPARSPTPQLRNFLRDAAVIVGTEVGRCK
jgi:hypothetical protein